MTINDFSNPPELLFRQGNEKYYGHHETVYNSMYYFKNMNKWEKHVKLNLLNQPHWQDILSHQDLY